MKLPLISIIAGLTLAGIVHISIILLIPALASQNAWSKLTSAGQELQFVNLNSAGANGEELLTATDPQFQTAACRFSLNGQALRIRAFGDLPFWSVAVFDQTGNIIYSFNDRTAVDQKLDILIVGSQQMSILRQNPPETVEQAIVVESSSNRGFALIRVLQADESWRAIVGSFLKEARCELFPL